jgi:hypothetical protein
MQRRNFIRLAGGGTVLAAAAASLSVVGCSTGMPAEAIEAWSGPAADIGEGDIRRWVLSYAILAPHSHNLQSWIADLRTPGEIVLTCDRTRLLPQTDPLARQIMMSHGTFLELLDLAARERGLRADIALFPLGAFESDKVDDRPVARVRLTPDSTVQKDPLFGYILQRRTHRGLYDSARPVPAAAWAAITKSTGQTGVQVGRATTTEAEAMAEHRRIALDAWRIELTTPRTIMESYAVLRVGPAEIASHRDGLSLLDAVPQALARVGLFDRARAPAPDAYVTTSQIADFEKKLASTPSFLWMVTAANDRITQVNAGRAYARVQLAATGQGLFMQPLSQALQEYPEQRVPYRQIHALAQATQTGQTVQMWARVGYAQPVGPAPRRPLKAFLRG